MPGHIKPEDIETAMLALVAERGAGRNLDPTEVARAVAGDKPDEWGPLMQPVRQAAVRLMKQGRLVILRKGRPVDPDDFRGIYRLTLPPSSGA
jgi:hypothetical protein